MECILSHFQNLYDLLFQKGDQILGRAYFLLLDSLAHCCNERLRRLNADIRHQQSLLEIVDQLIVNIGISDDEAFNIMREVLPCLRQTFFQSIKESHNSSFLLFRRTAPLHNPSSVWTAPLIRRHPLP